MRNRNAIPTVLFLVCCIGIASLCPAQDTAPAKVKRILIVGDSWAACIATTHHDPIPPGFGSLDAVLRDNNLGGYESVGGATAWGGREANDWVEPKNAELIKKQLEDNPTIDIVHLIIGGNDFLEAASKGKNIMSFSAEERAAIWDRIAADIQTIVDFCLAQRPDIRVLISDYDYLDTALGHAAYPKFDFGGASAADINTALMELGRKKLDIAKKTPRCYYVSHWGRLQQHYDSPKAGLPLPGGPPDYTPYAGGDPTSTMPRQAHVGDGIHPTDEAHRVLLQYCVDTFYREWLTKSGAQPKP